MPEYLANGAFESPRHSGSSGSGAHPNGDGGKDELTPVVRAQGNFAEYVPVLLLIGYLELGPSQPSFTVRILHPLGLRPKYVASRNWDCCNTRTVDCCDSRFSPAEPKSIIRRKSKSDGQTLINLHITFL